MRGPHAPNDGRRPMIGRRPTIVGRAPSPGVPLPAGRLEDDAQRAVLSERLTVPMEARPWSAIAERPRGSDSVRVATRPPDGTLEASAARLPGTTARI